VQVNSWGHPNTSGLETVDTFLSSARMEPPDGATHYTERLVALPNLSFEYEHPILPPSSLTRADLGLQAGEVAYFCCQSLPKYLPQFDDVFARVAREVPQSRVGFIEHHAGRQFGDIVRARFDRAFQAHGLAAADHIRFIPFMSPQGFRAASGCMDVFFDSLGWSGCNSTLEAVAQGVPVITWAGPLMRGRHSSAILEQMGMGDLVCATPEAAIEQAIRAGQDKTFREALRHRTAAAYPHVLGDVECVRGLERFIETEVGTNG
jgi:predicted O-linked N-acetylglucosamine transferase (SPINDLY family)